MGAWRRRCTERGKRHRRCRKKWRRRSMREGNMNPGASSLCVFLIGVVWTATSSFVTRRWHAKEIEKHFAQQMGRGRCRQLGQEMMTESSMRRSRNRAAILVKKNLTSKDRPVRTTGEDMNDNVNESARGNYLSMDRPRSTMQCKRTIAGHVKTNEEGSAQQIMRMAKILEGS